MHCLPTISLNVYAIHIVWVKVFHTFNNTRITGQLNDNISCVNIPLMLNSGSSIIDLSVAPSANLWNNNLFF